MIIMHGLFDLRETCTEVEFRQAFDAFATHLEQKKLITSWRFMRRSPGTGYDSSAPETKYYVNMEFLHLTRSQDSWNYVELDQEPVRSLHHAVNSKITNYVFYLCEDVASDGH